MNLIRFYLHLTKPHIISIRYTFKLFPGTEKKLHGNEEEDVKKKF